MSRRWLAVCKLSNGWTVQEAKYEKLRDEMVENQIIKRGITDKRVIQAMRTVPRHLFVPKKLQHLSYDDTPLPIGERQTISQPFIVAYMTEILELQRHHHVLEIGTGSGYQTALLAYLAQEVYTIEIVPELFKRAEERFDALGYTNIYCKFGDGSLGWPEHAPYDRIVVTAAATAIPDSLTEQLAPGGKMILPLGHADQRIVILTKNKEGRIARKIGPRVKFVPMTGLAEKLN